MTTRSRARFVLTGVDNTGWTVSSATVTPVGRPMLIHRVRATADPTVDAAAVTGAGTTDLALQLREDSTAALGVGGAPGAVGGVPLEYGLTPATPDLTIDSPEPAILYAPLSTGSLVVAVRTDAAPDSTVVVSIDYELI